MNLVKTSILSAIATLSRIITGFVINKIAAVYIGPSGLAYIGQFQNFINLALSLSGNALSTAITKYTAEYQDSKAEKHRIWSAALKVTSPSWILVSLLTFIFAGYLSVFLFDNDKYSYIIRIFSLSIPIYLFNGLILAILNGHRSVKKYIAINIISSFIGLSAVSLFTIFFALDGALVAYILGQFIVLIIAFSYVRHENWLKLENFRKKCSSTEVRKIISFAIITFTTVTASSVMLLSVRTYLTETFSSDVAGYWQGVWSISQISLTLITTSLSTYLLPTLSAIKEKIHISNELKKSYQLMMPVAIAISLLAYILREPIILILFTEQFMPMKDLFAWQFIGNIIKVAAWLLGYLIVAKAMVKTVVSTEIIFAILFIVLTKILTDHLGFIGVTHAYALNALLHLIAMMIIYHRNFQDTYKG